MFVIERERRNTNFSVLNGQENRRKNNTAIVKDDLLKCIEVQQWKYDNLQQFIENKEKKKFAIANTSFGVFAVLAGLTTALATLAGKYEGDPHSYIISSVYISLLVVIIGANLVNVAVIRYIAALKRDVLLAMRQLNCMRNSLHTMLFMLIEGYYEPTEDIMKMKGSRSTYSCGDYYNLIGKHIKYPLGNDAFRKLLGRGNICRFIWTHCASLWICGETNYQNVLFQYR